MSATTTATTPTAPAAFRGNPKDSMKSTWRNDKKQWGFAHYTMDTFKIHPSWPGHDAPVHQKTDKVPHVPDWHMHRWVLTFGTMPLIIHQAIAYFTGYNLSWPVAWIFYSFSYQFIGIHLFNTLRRQGLRYGFLDGDKHARDEVPDHSVGKVLASLISTATFRAMMSVMITYTASQTPWDSLKTRAIWIPLEIGVYQVVLDFWFYWYHRVMHEYDSLWRFHRTHHLTKHPNPLLTLYADHEQEFFDIVGIPFMTWSTMKLLGLPMGFYEWWMCQMYLVFTELSGHSGVRIEATPPGPFSAILKWLDCDLAIEDHDLHHRRGWKKSGNYGKQTRVWDRVFGTVLDRIEVKPENIDYENPGMFPLW